MKPMPAAGVDPQEACHRMTLEALAEVNAGRVIEHQAIRAWADSLDARTPLLPPLT